MLVVLLQTLFIRVLAQKIPSREITRLSRVGIPRSKAGARRVRTRVIDGRGLIADRVLLIVKAVVHKLGYCVVKRWKLLATYQAMISMESRPERR